MKWFYAKPRFTQPVAGTSMLVCSVCQALVIASHMTQHTEWHSQLDSLAKTAADARAQARGEVPNILQKANRKTDDLPISRNMSNHPPNGDTREEIANAVDRAGARGVDISFRASMDRDGNIRIEEAVPIDPAQTEHLAIAPEEDGTSGPDQGRPARVVLRPRARRT